MKIFKRLLTITLFVTLITLGATVEAVWQKTAWNFFTEVVMDTAIDVVQSFFRDDVKRIEVSALKYKVSDLERQLYSVKKEGYNPNDFRTIEQTILRLTKIVNVMDSKFSSLEDRVTSLENRVTVLEHIPFVQQSIVKWKVNSKTNSSTSAIVYSDKNTSHIGDEDFRSNRWMSLSGECYTAPFNTTFSARALVVELQTYGAEAHNLIYVNGDRLAILPPQGLRKPNKWTRNRKVYIILDKLISGYNKLKICAIPITFAPEFVGDKDDFQIRNIKIIIER